METKGGNQNSGRNGDIGSNQAGGTWSKALATLKLGFYFPAFWAKPQKA